MRVILSHLCSYSNQKVFIVSDHYGAVYFDFISMYIWYSKHPEQNNPACTYAILRYGGVIEGGHFFISFIYTLSLCGAFMAGDASQAGDADSSRAPGLTSCLQGSVYVHRGALLLVPQWHCISSFVFYI